MFPEFPGHACPARAIFHKSRGTPQGGIQLFVRPNDGRRPIMSDYRNLNYDYRNPEDPFPNDAKLDPHARAPNAAWGWIAAAVFLAVILAVAFGAGHRPGQPLGTDTASNDAAPPAATQMAPPATIRPPSTTPAPGTPTPPVTAAPNTHAQPGAFH
jgi:hypothetical protein